jgi:hypothetical protein
MRRKLLDATTLYNISDATDCIRLHVRRSYEGDAVSLICEKADVINAVFPPLTDVPFRRIKRDKDTRSWQLTSLVGSFEDGEQQKQYTIQTPYEFDVDVDDLIFRIFTDENQEANIIVILQVKELLGTFGHSRLILQKSGCVIATEAMPAEILETVQLMAERRSKLGF